LWKAFAPGESEPLFTLKATNAFSFKPRVNIFLPSNTAQKQPDYTIEGAFLAKKCRIYFGEELVAEVRDSEFVPFFISVSQIWMTFEFFSAVCNLPTGSA
jgi:hypothetical protein